MRQWKTESKTIEAPKPITPQVLQEQRKTPIVHYKVFTCELDSLEMEMNARANEIKDVIHIAHFGSAVKVLVRVV